MTAPAWVDQREIVEVTYRPEQLAFEDLLKHAVKHSCDQMIFTASDEQNAAATKLVGASKVSPFEKVTREAKASDRLYYLKQSDLRWMPLTPLQARRVNSALHAKQDPLPWLSPRQAKLLKRVSEARKDPVKFAEFKKLKHPRNMAGLASYSRALNSVL